MNTFVITGPSGSGKSHLVYELEPLGVYPLEVYTDRTRRPTEAENTDRVYLSKRQFSLDLEDFLYWFEFQGNRYGYKHSDITKQRKLGNPICFNIPPSHIPNILEKLPEATAIYLKVEEKHFPMLERRMLQRDVSSHDDDVRRSAKLAKIKKRLEYALEEMQDLDTHRDAMSCNTSSRIFDISGDEVLYTEVIPHIKKLIQKG
ncbi:hypothetical protein ACFL2C_00460 [Patescibacteria group bacterium]